MLQAGGIFALAAGVIAPFSFWLSASALLCAVALAFFSLKSPKERLTALLAFALLLWAGAASVPQGFGEIAHGEGEWRFWGVVTRAPRPYAGGLSLEVNLKGRAPPEPDGAFEPMAGKLILSVDGGVSPLPLEGDAVFWRGSLFDPIGLKNPGGELKPFYYMRQGIVARSAAKYPGEVFFAEPLDEGFLKKSRKELGAAMETAAGGEAGAVLRALVLGDYSGVSQVTIDEFRRCGTTHLLAVSGFHLGIVAFGAVALLSFCWSRIPYLALRVPAQLASAIGAVPLLIFYALLTGAQAATLRALFMTLLLVLAALLKIKTSFFNLLASAILVIGLYDPRMLFDPGLHLSAFALAGIFWLSPALFKTKREAEPEQKIKRLAGGGFAKALWEKALAILKTSFCATVATMPVSAYYFGGASLMGLMANPVGVPLVGAVSLPLGVAGAFLHPLWPTGAALCWKGAGMGLEILLKAQKFLSPKAVFISGPFTGLAAIVGGVVLAYSIVVFKKGGDKSLRRALWSAVLAATLIFGPPAFKWTLLAARSSARLYLFDVGNGQSAALSLPRKGFNAPFWVLVDGGGFPSSSYDIGKNQITPALKALGCERLDLAVSSHPHPDHLLGLVSVIREVGPKLLVLPESFKGDERYGLLLLAASEGGVPVRWVGPGAYELPECPGISIFSSPGPGENDKSLMVVAESGGEAVLVSGDVESRGQENILSLLPEGDFLAATAPHHGLPDAFLRAFWEKVRPRKILVSSQNGGKSPCAELRGIAGEQSASIFTTGEVGYILAEFGGTDAEPKAAR